MEARARRGRSTLWSFGVRIRGGAKVTNRPDGQPGWDSDDKCSSEVALPYANSACRKASWGSHGYTISSRERLRYDTLIAPYIARLEDLRSRTSHA
jgi:hypothetical protein